MLLVPNKVEHMGYPLDMPICPAATSASFVSPSQL